MSKYDRTGNLLKEWGEYSPGRILQERSNGGGIVTDGQFVYYSYLGDHKIWKYDFEGNLINIFDHAPEYYRTLDYNKLSGMCQNDILKIYFDACKMWGIYYVEQGYIIQEFTFGNPREGEEVEKYLEIWDNEGNKIITNLKAEKYKILGAFKDKVVFIDEVHNTPGIKPQI